MIFSGIIYGSAQAPNQSGRGTVTTSTGSRIVRNASSGVISGRMMMSSILDQTARESWALPYIIPIFSVRLSFPPSISCRPSGCTYANQVIAQTPPCSLLREPCGPDVRKRRTSTRRRGIQSTLWHTKSSQGIGCGTSFRSDEVRPGRSSMLGEREEAAPEGGARSRGPGAARGGPVHRNMNPDYVQGEGWDSRVAQTPVQEAAAELFGRFDLRSAVSGELPKSIAIVSAAGLRIVFIQEHE